LLRRTDGVEQRASARAAALLKHALRRDALQEGLDEGMQEGGPSNDRGVPTTLPATAQKSLDGDVPRGDASLKGVDGAPSRVVLKDTPGEV
jgi:hypothetical protein